MWSSLNHLNNDWSWAKIVSRSDWDHLGVSSNQSPAWSTDIPCPSDGEAGSTAHMLSLKNRETKFYFILPKMEEKNAAIRGERSTFAPQPHIIPLHLGQHRSQDTLCPLQALNDTMHYTVKSCPVHSLDSLEMNLVATLFLEASLPVG